MLAGDSDFEWAQFLIDQGVLDREVYEARNQDFYEQYKAGTLDIHEFLDFQLKPLSRHPRSVLDEWHREFMRERILPIITRKARDLVAEPSRRRARDRHGDQQLRHRADRARVRHRAPDRHRAGGARRASSPAACSGMPSFREGKVVRLEAWLAEHGLSWKSFSETWFYSDSLNDLPLLSKVTHPVAVDPDETLKETALEQGWIDHQPALAWPAVGVCAGRRGAGSGAGKSGQRTPMYNPGMPPAPAAVRRHHRLRLPARGHPLRRRSTSHPCLPA